MPDWYYIDEEQKLVYNPMLIQDIRNHFDDHGELTVREALQDPWVRGYIEDEFVKYLNRKPTYPEVRYHIEGAKAVPSAIQSQVNRPLNPYNWSSTGFKPKNMWAPKNQFESEHRMIERGPMFNRRDYQWNPSNFWRPKRGIPRDELYYR